MLKKSGTGSNLSRLQLLFSARSLTLFSNNGGKDSESDTTASEPATLNLTPEYVPSYLSGLLIGSEIAQNFENIKGFNMPPISTKSQPTGTGPAPPPGTGISNRLILIGDTVSSETGN